MNDAAKAFFNVYTKLISAATTHLAKAQLGHLLKELQKQLK
jgi:hypothetical protein